LEGDAFHPDIRMNARTDYKFISVPQGAAIEGRIMGRNGDYLLIRAEDIVWLMEAIEERRNLILYSPYESSTPVVVSAVLVKEFMLPFARLVGPNQKRFVDKSMLDWNNVDTMAVLMGGASKWAIGDVVYDSVEEAISRGTYDMAVLSLPDIPLNGPYVSASLVNAYKKTVLIDTIVGAYGVSFARQCEGEKADDGAHPVPVDNMEVYGRDGYVTLEGSIELGSASDRGQRTLSESHYGPYYRLRSSVSASRYRYRLLSASKFNDAQQNPGSTEEDWYASGRDAVGWTSSQEEITCNDLEFYIDVRKSALRDEFNPEAAFRKVKAWIRVTMKVAINDKDVHIGVVHDGVVEQYVYIDGAFVLGDATYQRKENLEDGEGNVTGYRMYWKCSCDAQAVVGKLLAKLGTSLANAKNLNIDLPTSPADPAYITQGSQGYWAGEADGLVPIGPNRYLVASYRTDNTNSAEGRITMMPTGGVGLIIEFNPGFVP